MIYESARSFPRENQQIRLRLHIGLLSRVTSLQDDAIDMLDALAEVKDLNL